MQIKKSPWEVAAFVTAHLNGPAMPVGTNLEKYELMNEKYTCMKIKPIQIFVLLLILITPIILFASETQERQESFSGVWTGENGSVYEFKDDKLMCISVSSKKTGWIGKNPFENIRKTDGIWTADAAVRFGHTGDLLEWLKAEIEIIGDELTIYYPPNRYGTTKTISKRTNKE